MNDLKIMLLKLFFSEKHKAPIIKPKKILLIKTGAIGDVIMTTPLLREIRKLFPKAKKDYLVGNWSKEVLYNNPNIGNIIGFDEKIMLKKRLIGVLKLARQLRKEKYDLCFVLDRSYLLNIFAKLLKIQCTIGFDRDGEGFALTNPVKMKWGNHHIKEYLRLLEPYNHHAKNYRTEVFPSEEDIKIAGKFLKKTISNKINKTLIGIAPLSATNPGENAMNRRWPETRYFELMKKLLERRATILLFGGPSEKNELEQIRIKLSNENVHNCAGLNINQSILLMKKTELFITHDSGPMHMASCSGTKVLSLFGPTNPNEKAPLDNKSLFIWKQPELLKKGIKADYLTKGGMEKISVQETYKKAAKMLR